MSRRLKPYPSYKDSGVEWLGRIPTHWQVKRLKWTVSSGRKGGMLIKGQMASEPAEGFFPGYSASGQDVWVEQAEYHQAGIVLSAVGARCGKAFRADGDWTAIANTHVLLPTTDFDRDFLWRIFDDEEFWKKGGSAQPYVQVSDSLDRHWAVPPRDEQQAIAEFLDRETGKIDALVKKKERLIELLQEKRTALISHAVTQGLNPNAPQKDSGIPWLGHVPKQWECGRLKVRLKKIGQGWSPLCENRPAQEGEWGVLKVGCMNGNIYDEAENKALPIEIEPAKELEIRVGDVLMSRSNTVELVGSVGIVHETQGKILLCDKLFRLVFDQTKLLPEYAVSLLRSPVARKQIEAASSGASPSMKNISNGAVAGLVLPFPPVDEQQVMLKRISEQTTKLDALMAKVRTAMERLQEYRTALISAAVTGQIDVRPFASHPGSTHADTRSR